MTICFLSTCQFNEFTGGMDRVCCLLSREFIRRGYRLIYVFGIPSQLGHPAEGCDGDGQFQFPYTIWDDRNIAFFSELVRSQGIDIVIDAAFVSRYHDVVFQAKKQTPFKLITTFHGDPFCDLKELRDRMEWLPLEYTGLSLIFHIIKAYIKYPISYFLRFRSLKSRFTKMVKESDYYVVLCDDYAKQIRRITKDNNPVHIVSISNPIDLSRSETGNSVKKNQVLFVGRLNEQKRVDRLLRVWAKVEKHLGGWDLVIVGDGDARIKYETYAHRLRLTNVHFLGNVNSSEEMKLSKIVTIVSSHEGFGMTLVEGMMAGAIPIAFNSYAAVHDIIKDGDTGFIIPPFDENIFAERIVGLASNEIMFKKMQKMALQSLSHFSVERIVGQWETLFN